MLGSDFYAYCLRVFKRTDKETDFYEALTDVIMDIKLRYFFEDFKEEAYSGAIVSLGDYKIQLPQDFGYLIGDAVLQDAGGNDKQLKKLDKATFDLKYPNPNSLLDQRSFPEHYCIYSGQLLLGPVPDSIDYQYQINYSTEAAEQITALTANVPFSDRYRWILRYLVLGELYSNMGFDSEGAKFKSKGEDGIALMVARDEWNTDPFSTQDYKDI